MEAKNSSEPVAFLFDCGFFFAETQKVPYIIHRKPKQLPIDIPLHIIEEAEEEERW